MYTAPFKKQIIVKEGVNLVTIHFLYISLKLFAQSNHKEFTDFKT